MDLTREQSIALAAGLAGVLRKQGGNLADLAGDIPKLISLGHDVAGVVQTVKAAGDHPITAPAVPSPEPEQAAKPAPAAPQQRPKPPAAPARPAAKVTAKEMVEVAQSGGFSPQERAMFDPARSGFG